MSTYTLCRCAGAVTCWSAAVSSSDIGETDHDLGHLIERIWERGLAHGETPTFLLSVTDEAERAALDQRRETEVARLEREARDATAVIKRNRKRMDELRPQASEVAP